ncbi:MAG: UDP-4-amino-4,6-dideoxy-N-acetyl-beta-L-altrosamine transaminase [Proteobacteria bacterium]|nr:UDP-4-amino-4,6-dideoxy-N-acetyl-beta-L-altrosamine transaminase [Pseudomonadota bacterium]
MTGAQPAKLPYGRQHLDDDDIAAVVAVLRGDWLTTGPAVAGFERDFAAAVGARYAVACSSATAGLHLAMLALELGPAHAVIVPALTFVASANAARYVGAEVVFADVDPKTGLMGAAELTAAFDRAAGRTVRAIVPVHLNGQCADLEALSAVAKERGAVLVEDAAHAVGASYRRSTGMPAPVGSCADSAMAVFSLHPVKTITMGEGGVVTTNDASLAGGLGRLRSHGIEREAGKFQNRAYGFEGCIANPWYYELQALGFNYRATDIHCALGASQLRKLSRFVAHRRRLLERYAGRLRNLSPHLSLLPARAQVEPAWHLAVVMIEFSALGLSRARVMRNLAERGIGTQVHYIPVYQHPYYRDLNPGLALPGTEDYYSRCLTLPLSVEMNESDVDRVADGLIEVCGLQTATPP